MTHVHVFELGKTDLTKKQINQIFRYIKQQTGVSRRMIDSIVLSTVPIAGRERIETFSIDALWTLRKNRKPNILERHVYRKYGVHIYQNMDELLVTFADGGVRP